MKLKNQISQASLEGIICILALFIIHLLLAVGIFIISINSGMTFAEFWEWVADNFINGEFELKLIILYLIFAPLLWLVLSIVNIKERTIDVKKANNHTHTIKDIIFEKEGICIRYKNPQLFDKKITYKNITNFKLTVKTGISYNKYGSYSCIFGASLSLCDIENKEYSIYYSPVNINNLYKLVYYSQFMKNFEYEFSGNGEQTKEKLTKNINKIIKNGYKTPFSIKITNYMVKGLLGFAAIMFVFGIYMITPNFSNTGEKEYASIVENGYTYFQNNMYSRALIEYDKALDINNEDHVLYYYRALVFEHEGKYDKAIQEAEKGIQYIDKNSVYFKVKNYKFIKDDIGLYDTLANCYMQLKEYNKAISALNYIEKHNKYKFTDVYFKRGMCEFYMNQKNKALDDFEKHRDIIFDYIAEQESSEYKAMYPTYTQKDVANINNWIRATRK